MTAKVRTISGQEYLRIYVFLQLCIGSQEAPRVSEMTIIQWRLLRKMKNIVFSHSSQLICWLKDVKHNISFFFFFFFLFSPLLLEDCLEHVFFYWTLERNVGEWSMADVEEEHC